MLILCCGSRGWSDEDAAHEAICGALDVAATEFHNVAEEVIVMHGDARGADRMSARIAGTLGCQVRAFPANWKAHGKRAGILRNLAMLDEGPDLVLAFWDGKSPGTRHTIAEARKRGITVRVIS